MPGKGAQAGLFLPLSVATADFISADIVSCGEGSMKPEVTGVPTKSIKTNGNVAC